MKTLIFNCDCERFQREHTITFDSQDANELGWTACPFCKKPFEEAKCYGKLPDPTPEQAECNHEKWKNEQNPPRNCLECGLQMWDAGD